VAYIRIEVYSNASIKMVLGCFEEPMLAFHLDLEASTNFLSLSIAKALSTLLVES
jgi:hypothetical protein